MIIFRNNKKMNIDEAIDLFEFAKNQYPNSSHSDFYCGITNDLQRRCKEHNIQEDDLCASVTSDNFNSAKELEQRLFEKGFDCGNQIGNGDEDSIYVYMYKKTKDTKQ